MIQSKIAATFLTKRNTNMFDLLRSIQLRTNKKNKWKWIRAGKKRFRQMKNLADCHEQRVQINSG